MHGPDFLAVFESSPAAILLVSSDDPVFTVLAVSDAYLKIAGVQAGGPAWPGDVRSFFRQPR